MRKNFCFGGREWETIFLVSENVSIRLAQDLGTIPFAFKYRSCDLGNNVKCYKEHRIVCFYFVTLSQLDENNLIMVSGSSKF